MVRRQLLTTQRHRQRAHHARSGCDPIHTHKPISPTPPSLLNLVLSSPCHSPFPSPTSFSIASLTLSTTALSTTRNCWYSLPSASPPALAPTPPAAAALAPAWLEKRSAGGPWLAAQRATWFSCLRARWALQKSRSAESASASESPSGGGGGGEVEAESGGLGDWVGVAESDHESGLRST